MKISSRELKMSQNEALGGEISSPPMFRSRRARPRGKGREWRFFATSQNPPKITFLTMTRPHGPDGQDTPNHHHENQEN